MNLIRRFPTVYGEVILQSNYTDLPTCLREKSLKIGVRKFNCLNWVLFGDEGHTIEAFSLNGLLSNILWGEMSFHNINLTNLLAKNLTFSKRGILLLYWSLVNNFQGRWLTWGRWEEEVWKQNVEPDKTGSLGQEQCNSHCGGSSEMRKWFLSPEDVLKIK